MVLRVFPKHIVCLDFELFVTNSAWYGKHKHFFRKIYPKINDDIKKIKANIGLKNFVILFRFLPKRLNGCTYPSTGFVYIDPRRYTYDELLITIIHEALHVKQIEDGKLKWDKKLRSRMWNNEPIDIIAAVNQLGYANRKLPWEIDVDKNQNKVFRKVFKRKIPPMNPKMKCHTK